MHCAFSTGLAYVERKGPQALIEVQHVLDVLLQA